MSALELALRNLAAWSLQVGVLGLAAAALARLLPVERPAIRLALGQALLALVLGLPLVQPWHATAAAVSWSFALAPSTAALSVRPCPAPIRRRRPLSGPRQSPASSSSRGPPPVPARRRPRPPALAATPRPATGRTPVAPDAARRGRAAGPFLLSDETGTRPRSGSSGRSSAPPVFESMDRPRQEAVVFHELLHARRADWLALLLEDVLKAALFFTLPSTGSWGTSASPASRPWTPRSYAASAMRGLPRVAGRGGPVRRPRTRGPGRALPAREPPPGAGGSAPERGTHVPCPHPRHLGLTAIALVLAVSWAASAVPLQTAKPAAPTRRSRSRTRSRPPPSRSSSIRPSRLPAGCEEGGVQGLFRIEVLIGKDGAIKEAHVAASAPTAERLKEVELAAKKGAPAATEGDAASPPPPWTQSSSGATRRSSSPASR